MSEQLTAHKYTYKIADATETVKLAFLSDIHIDSNYCNTKKLKDVLDRCAEENIDVFIFGDLFDAMQGKNDPRNAKQLLKKDYLRDDYINAIVEDAAEFLKPYQQNIRLIGYGNHETSLIKHHEVDIIKLLQEKMERSFDLGGYEGFIQFSIGNDNFRYRFVVFYTHGNSGQAPITMGILQHKRYQIWLDSVDMIISGHNHNHWVYTQPVCYLDQKGTIRVRNTWHLKLGTFLNRKWGMGFEAEKGIPPSIEGGWMVEIKVKRKDRYKQGDYKPLDVKISQF